MIARTLLPQIERQCFKGKVIIIYGARQVGKTTLCEEILKQYGNEAVYFNGDLRKTRTLFSSEDEVLLGQNIQGKKLVIIDEAQRISNIGLNLKILHQYFPEVQCIATGSSSFELSSTINEPLTGRASEFSVYPLSTREVMKNALPYEASSYLPALMIYGGYPEIYTLPEGEKQGRLLYLTNTYLYKDILELYQIRNSQALQDLLSLLALQIGSEVSYNELSRTLGINVATVQHYIDLLEKSFIIFRLRGFSRNLRKEIAKSQKIFFWDLGIRNALINNFNPLDLRNDVGALWENFVIAERQKNLAYTHQYRNTYFWRTYDKKEIDYIEEYDGKLDAYEIKWNTRASKKTKIPKLFLETYENSKFQVLDQNNIFEFIS